MLEEGIRTQYNNTGIAAGIIVDGKIVNGAGGIAGDLEKLEAK